MLVQSLSDSVYWRCRIIRTECTLSIFTTFISEGCHGSLQCFCSHLLPVIKTDCSITFEQPVSFVFFPRRRVYKFCRFSISFSSRVRSFINSFSRCSLRIFSNSTIVSRRVSIVSRRRLLSLPLMSFRFLI